SFGEVLSPLGRFSPRASWLCGDEKSGPSLLVFFLFPWAFKPQIDAPFLLFGVGALLRLLPPLYEAVGGEVFERPSRGVVGQPEFQRDVLRFRRAVRIFFQIVVLADGLISPPPDGWHAVAGDGQHDIHGRLALDAEHVEAVKQRSQRQADSGRAFGPEDGLD